MQCCHPQCAINLCLRCFSTGTETLRHSVSHPYTLCSLGISSEWTYEEELSLLEVIIKCGYGNWDEIAKHFQKKQMTPVQLKRHFDNVYVHGNSFSPELNDSSFNVISSHEEISYKRLLHHFPVLGPSEDPPRSESKEQRQKNYPVLQGSKHLSSWIFKNNGYFPSRAEFSCEWNNQAETLLSMVRSPTVTKDDEKDLETELRLGLGSIYNYQVSQRYKLKRLIREHSLIHKVKVKESSIRLKSRSKFWNLQRLTKFSQLFCAWDMDLITEGFHCEFELRSKVIQLQEIRKSGLKMRQSFELMGILMERRREQLATINIDKMSDMISTGLTKDNRLSFTSIRRIILPLDIAGLPGYEKISDDERNLCSLLRITPVIYLEIKQILQEECTKNKGLRLADARKSIKIDVNKTRKIYDFLLEKCIIWNSVPSL